MDRKWSDLEIQAQIRGQIACSLLGTIMTIIKNDMNGCAFKLPADLWAEKTSTCSKTACLMSFKN